MAACCSLNVLMELKQLQTPSLSTGAKGGGHVSLLNVLMELKKCCNHPFLFESAEEVRRVAGFLIKEWFISNRKTSDNDRPIRSVAQSPCIQGFRGGLLNL